MSNVAFLSLLIVVIPSVCWWNKLVMWMIIMLQFKQQIWKSIGIAQNISFGTPPHMMIRHTNWQAYVQATLGCKDETVWTDLSSFRASVGPRLDNPADRAAYRPWPIKVLHQAQGWLKV